MHLSALFIAISLFIQACTGSTAKVSKSSADATTLRDGDIIFQTTTSDFSRAIQAATHSRYSHVGIIFSENGKYHVYEAVQPVKSTPLEEWTRRGQGGHYVVKRLKDADKVLTKETLAKMKTAGDKYRGLDYDMFFHWSDTRMYCSELVWKIYKRGAGLEVGALQKFGDFDLSSEIVKQQIREIHGGKAPLEEQVISPAAMFDSELLTTVVEK